MNSLVNPMNNLVNNIVTIIEVANKLHIYTIPMSISIFTSISIPLDLPREQHGDHNTLFIGLFKGRTYEPLICPVNSMVTTTCCSLGYSLGGSEDP